MLVTGCGWVPVSSVPRGSARRGLCERIGSGQLAAATRIVEGCAASRSWQHPVIPIREDEPQVLLGRALNKLVMDPLELFGINWPWLP